VRRYESANESSLNAKNRPSQTRGPTTLGHDRHNGHGTHTLRPEHSLAWEGVAVHHLHFEATVAVVLGFVVLFGFVLIGLLHAVSI
jgi:hypothetical protein